MKKSLIAVLAIAGVVACNKTEVVEVAQPGAIQFENAFVENATRAAEDPSTTTANLAEFAVYGYMDAPSGIIFNAEKVSKNEAGAWTYTNIQYWAPNHTYYFGALAPSSTEVDTKNANEFGIGTVSFENTDGTTDLLYAAETRTTGASIDAQPEAVKFNFNHLLSKVKFSFTNGFNNTNATITVKNIKMVAPKNGTINLAQADWWSTNQWVLGEGTTTLDFGDMETGKVTMGQKSESAKERLVIPTTGSAEQVYTVTFDVELYYGDQLAYSSSLETEISWVDLVIGKAYNFHATLDASNIVPGEDGELYPIEFTATVKDWVDGNGYDGGVIDTGAQVETPEA